MKRAAQVVAFGEVIWDLSFCAPAGTASQLPASFVGTPGGASANLATVLARLGVRTSVVAGVGDDFLGRDLRARLACEGIDVRGLRPRAARTGVTFVTRDERGEPHFLNYRQHTADLALGPRDLPPWPRSARWLVIGSTHTALPEMMPATRRIARDARAAGAYVAVDLNARRWGFASAVARRRAVAKLLATAALVKASSPDLAALQLGSAHAVRMWLAKHAPDATLLLTDAGAGATARGVHGTARAGGEKAARVVDASGAGDAFLAGVLAVLLATRAEPGTAAWADPEIWTTAVEVGHSLGRKVVSRIGGTTGARNVAVARRLIVRLRDRSRPR